MKQNFSVIYINVLFIFNKKQKNNFYSKIIYFAMSLFIFNIYYNFLKIKKIFRF